MKSPRAGAIFPEVCPRSQSSLDPLHILVLTVFGLRSTVLYIHILFYNVYVNNYYMITSSFCWFVQVLRVQAVKRRVTRGRAITNYKSG